MRLTLAFAAVAAAFSATAPAAADEGMWTFDGVPTDAIRKAYGVGSPGTELEFAL